MSNTDSPTGTNRHALTAVEKQRAQLDRLLKDPAKPAYIPPPPKEKTIRPPKEMMKNVQGSSAGAGSGEFHVYKANRRREYERIKLMEEENEKEAGVMEFERKRREREEEANAKTAKNRAKRLKKKERAANKGQERRELDKEPDEVPGAPIKKRRLVNGKEMLFKRPGDDSSAEEEEEVAKQPQIEEVPNGGSPDDSSLVLAEATGSRIVVHED